MSETIIDQISKDLSLPRTQISNVLNLLDDGATIPFIARYRKEQTGNLDEVQIQNIRDFRDNLLQIEKRRSAILESLEENGHLTPELKSKILSASSLSILEDMYLPYRPKRKTRASMAIEKGLEPLGLEIIKNNEPTPALLQKFVNPSLGVEDEKAALSGAIDIAAERISEHPEIRAALREQVFKRGKLLSKKARGTKDLGSYADYVDKNEELAKMTSHRFLAFFRGQNEEILSLSMDYPEDEAMKIEAKLFINRPWPQITPSLKTAFLDAWNRLIKPSLETETFHHYKEIADQKAILVFSENLKQLLLASPLGQKRVLALDPGLRTGCKLVCLSAQGHLLEHTVIYPLEPHKKVQESALILKKLVEKYQIQAIAIGNGTGGREAFDFVKSLGLASVGVFSVNESGASIYSASEIARKEFPNEDITVRGAVSIGRRLIDPLAELVKIDPKSIGVGQYQHDVDQKLLKKGLEDVVTNCVNKVGVDLNTASAEILTYISGLNQKLADALVSYRTNNGPFKSREDLVKVKGFGTKTFEQAAGFLRIRGGTNPLDGSGVHPERYELVCRVAKDLKRPLNDLIGKKIDKNQLKMESYFDGTFGKETWDDIFSELERPGLDPREEKKDFHFDDNIKEISDLKEGMVLSGIISNVTAFGAFVDIGVHQDGLIHISQLADHFVNNPMDVVKIGQEIKVKVLSVDIGKKRISLSSKGLQGQGS